MRECWDSNPDARPSFHLVHQRLCDILQVSATWIIDVPGLGVYNEVDVRGVGCTGGTPGAGVGVPGWVYQWGEYTRAGEPGGWVYQRWEGKRV